MKMDIEKALKLKNPGEILAAAKEAEQRNVEHHIIQKLWAMYFAIAGDN